MKPVSCDLRQDETGQSEYPDNDEKDSETCETPRLVTTGDPEQRQLIGSPKTCCFVEMLGGRDWEARSTSCAADSHGDTKSQHGSDATRMAAQDPNRGEWAWRHPSRPR